MFEITGTRGYVVGIFLSRIPDGDDVDRIPDVVAASIKPSIKRTNSKEPIALLTPDHGAHGVFLSTKEFPCALMDNGHLTSDIDAQGNAKPDATPGIWLPVGDYVISLAGHTQDIEFSVKPEHTMENPLDLYQYASVAPSDDVIMQVVEVPTGGLPNQALAWSTNGLTWYDPPANELTIGTVGEGPASATISGDAPNQVLDLTIPRGLDGAPNSLSIGTVTEGPASASITGQTPNQTLNLSLPKGNTGATPTLASGTVSKIAAGGDPTAAVRRNGTTDQYFLDLGLVTGADGSPTPYDKRGTGMPNGVVTGNPGDTYTDTAGTNGAWRWRKASGTGNTGWVVVDGDTGWRDVTSTCYVHETGIYLVSVNYGGISVRILDKTLYVRIGNYRTSDSSALAHGHHIRIPSVTALSGLGLTNSTAKLPDQLQEYFGDISYVHRTSGTVQKLFTLPCGTWPTALPGTAA